MLKISSNLVLNEAELKFTFIRSPGPGGQNVNKVATAIQLRFNVRHSPSLSEEVRARLVAAVKLTRQGDLIIKATRFRTQERNKQDALDRLITVLKKASLVPKKRKKTKPTLASTERRLAEKKRHAKAKSLRRGRAASE
jgi:ribosome-associated protein